MIFQAKPGQVSYGEPIGIILLDSCAPYIPGDVANATTYSFPVRFQKVLGLTVKRIFNHDMTLLNAVIEAATDLKRNGVRAVTGDCGFMIIYQRELANCLELPVFLSSMLQLTFMLQLIPEKGKIGIVTASAEALDDDVLQCCGVGNNISRLVIRGLEDCPNFASAIIKETSGELNFDLIKEEVASTAKKIIMGEPDVRLILLECSVLSPYGEAVQQATGLPVFDYVTMINYVYATVIKQRFNGYM